MLRFQSSWAWCMPILIMLASCLSVPEKPDFEITLTGNYQQIADCAWAGFRDLGSWTKADLPSQRRSEFTFSSNNYALARITVIGISNTHTKIASHFPPAIYGPDYWPNRHRPIFERCAQPMPPAPENL